MLSLTCSTEAASPTTLSRLSRTGKAGPPFRVGVAGCPMLTAPVSLLLSGSPLGGADGRLWVWSLSSLLLLPLGHQHLQVALGDSSVSPGTSRPPTSAPLYPNAPALGGGLCPTLPIPASGLGSPDLSATAPGDEGGLSASFYRCTPLPPPLHSSPSTPALPSLHPYTPCSVFPWLIHGPHK